MDDLVGAQLNKISKAKGEVTDEVFESLMDDAFDKSIDDMVGYTDLLVPDETIGVGKNIGRLITNASNIEERELGKLSFKEIQPALNKARREIAEAKGADSAKSKATLKKFDNLIDDMRQFNKPADKRVSLEDLSTQIDDQLNFVNKLEADTAGLDPRLVTKETASLRDARGRLSTLRQQKKALESGEDAAFSIRDLQDFKVARGKDAAQAFEQSAEDRSVVRQAHMALYKVIDNTLTKRMSLVDEVAGTDLTTQLVKERRLYSNLKDFMPIANELQVAERLGKLASRKRVNRKIPFTNAEINELTAGGVGSGVASTLLPGNPAVTGTLGFGVGAAAAKKSLPSRMQRITKSLDQLEFLTGDKLFPGQSAAAPLIKPATLNTIGRAASKLSSSEQMTALQDAVFTTLAQDRGLFAEDAFAADQIDPAMEEELEIQMKGQLQPLEDAIKFGDEQDVAMALSETAKRFPEAFPKPKSGIHGEVIMNGKTTLPSPDDRMKYSDMIKKDPTLSVTEKANAISAVNFNGEVTALPKSSGARKRQPNLFAIPRAGSNLHANTVKGRR